MPRDSCKLSRCWKQWYFCVRVPLFLAMDCPPCAAIFCNALPTVCRYFLQCIALHCPPCAATAGFVVASVCCGVLLLLFLSGNCNISIVKCPDIIQFKYYNVHELIAMCHYSLSMHSEPCASTSALWWCISGGSQTIVLPERIRRMPLFFLARPAQKYIACPPELVRKSLRKIDLRMRWQCDVIVAFP